MNPFHPATTARLRSVMARPYGERGARAGVRCGSRCRVTSRHSRGLHWSNTRPRSHRQSFARHDRSRTCPKLRQKSATGTSTCRYSFEPEPSRTRLESLLILEIALWVGLASSVATLAGLGYSPRLRSAIASVVPFNGTAWYARTWTTHTLNREIARAKTEVCVLQTWLPTLNADVNYWESTAGRVSFRVLLAHRNVVASRLACRPLAIPLTEQNVARLRSARRPNGDGFKLRQYDGLPFGPVYIIDDVVYWGIFLADRDALLGPRFKTHRSSHIGSMIVESFEALWKSGSHWGEEAQVDLDKELDGPKVDGVTADPERELFSTAGNLERFQRQCASCEAWLSYRSFGPPGAIATESFCPNPDCPRFDERVEGVPVS